MEKVTLKNVATSLWCKLGKLRRYFDIKKNFSDIFKVLKGNITVKAHY